MAKLLREIVEKKLPAPRESQSNKANTPTNFAGKKSSKVAPPDIDKNNFYNWEGGDDGVKFIKKHKTETHDYPHDDEAVFKGKKGGSKQTDKYKFAPKDTYEEVEQVDEKLTKGMSAGEVISDFVHSDDPKFAGKSKKERMRMALGAYYSMNPSKSRKKMEEAAVCNMTEAGKMCEVHGEAECPGYKMERKGGRKLLLGGKKKMEEAADVPPAQPMLEGGKKSKKKMKNEQAAPYDGGSVPNVTGAMPGQMSGAVGDGRI